MNEIKLLSIEGFLNMRFLNGDIIVPNTPGIKVISSGCGSGKTTIIKELIKRCNSKGIIYASSTIKECDEMYDWVVNNIVGTYDDYGSKLDISEVSSIHNSPRKDNYGNITNGIDLDSWNNNPEVFRSKKIIICTHHKLLHESPKLLIDYDLNIVYPDFFNEYEIVGRSNKLPRKYVLIDELPRCGVLKKSFNINDIKSLGFSIKNKRYDKDGKPYIVSDYTRYEDFFIVLDTYNEMEKSDSRLRISGSDSEPSELRKRLILSDIHKNYRKYVLSKSDEIKISCNILNLINPWSNIMIFEGTGDLLFENNNITELYSIEGSKYNSDINIEIINNPLSRKISDVNSIDGRNSLMNNINDLILNLRKNVFNKNYVNKVLIVTWKNLKSSDNSDNLGLLKIGVNENFDFKDYIDKELLGTVSKEYKIIHYQSGLDRATNEFRDFDTVVFLGEFHIPNNAIEEINRDLGCSTTPNNFTTHQLVQAICRTRIRKHNNSSINIFFTDDWSKGDIYRLKEYLGIRTTNKSVNTDQLGIKNKWKVIIDKLINYDPEILTSITLNKEYKFNISLEEIYKLMPMSEYKIKKYYPLINYLKTLNIEMVISSNSNNKGAKS